MGGKSGFTTIRKDTLSGATPQQIRSQTTELAPSQLRWLAVSLAEDPNLSVSVITYENGMQELEVLHSGPPGYTEDTIDHRKFTRKPDATPAGHYPSPRDQPWRTQPRQSAPFSGMPSMAPAFRLPGHAVRRS